MYICSILNKKTTNIASCFDCFLLKSKQSWPESKMYQWSNLFTHDSKL